MNAVLYRAASAYANVDLATSVEAASPHRLIVMLFDAAILSVSKAMRSMERGDIANKGLAVSKAIQIIEEGLKASLDEQQGGKLARQLSELYRYMSHRLVLASARNQRQGFEEVANLLGEIKRAWSDIGIAAGDRAGVIPIGSHP